MEEGNEIHEIMKFGDKNLTIYGTKDEPAFVVNEICGIIQIDKKGTLIKIARKDYKYQGCFQNPPEY